VALFLLHYDIRVSLISVLTVTTKLYTAIVALFKQLAKRVYNAWY